MDWTGARCYRWESRRGTRCKRTGTSIFTIIFYGFYCVSYPVDSLGVSVRGKTQSVPFGKGMLEKNLIPLEEEPQNIYLAWTILQGGVLTHFGFTGCFCEETHPELSQLREYQLQGPFSWQRNPTFWVHACCPP